MSSHKPMTAQQRHTMRPLVYGFWIGMPALIGGMCLNAYASDVFASLGGWATVIPGWIAAVIVGYLVYMRRLRRVQAGPDA